MKKRRRIISKAGYNCVVDYDVFSYNQGSEKKLIMIQRGVLTIGLQIILLTVLKLDIRNI